jgi:hypothetical protein
VLNGRLWLSGSTEGTEASMLLNKEKLHDGTDNSGFIYDLKTGTNSFSGISEEDDELFSLSRVISYITRSLR